MMVEKSEKHEILKGINKTETVSAFFAIGGSNMLHMMQMKMRRVLSFKIALLSYPVSVQNKKEIS